MNRTHYTTGAPWEDIVGYSRAIKVGNIIEVSGTVATNEQGEVVGKDDPYQQTRYILEKIGKVLEQAGATHRDVVRTRMYVVNIGEWELIGKAHGEFFADIRPATSMVEVSRLIDPAMLVEIEADAIIPE